MQAASFFFPFFFFNFTGTIYFCERTDVSSITSEKIYWEVLKNVLIQLLATHPDGYCTSKNIEGMVNNRPQWKTVASIDSNFLNSEIQWLEKEYGKVLQRCLTGKSWITISI